MIFSLNSIDEESHPRQFSCQLNSLEDGFDLLNDIVAMGHTLLRVRILDQNSVTELPVEAFDGISCSRVIKQLETEWLTILNGVSPSDSPNSLDPDQWTQHWIDFYEKRIVRFDVTISRLEILIQRADKGKFKSEALIDLYKTIINGYKTQLTSAYMIRQRLLARAD